LLPHAFVPLCYWNDAFSTACFLINRLPSRTIDMQTPVESLLHETPDYTFFKVFGCACWPHIRPYNDHKIDLDTRSVSFWGIVRYTKVTSVFMSLLIEPIFLGM
jgi:histone deacetylase 1/2